MSEDVLSQYLRAARTGLDAIEATQLPAVRAAARLFADAILADRLVHVFGTGHSRMAVEEMFPRYGSFPGFHPIVELSMSFHNPVVGLRPGPLAQLRDEPGRRSARGLQQRLQRRDDRRRRRGQAAGHEGRRADVPGERRRLDLEA